MRIKDAVEEFGITQFEIYRLVRENRVRLLGSKGDAGYSYTDISRADLYIELSDRGLHKMSRGLMGKCNTSNIRKDQKVNPSEYHCKVIQI